MGLEGKVAIVTGGSGGLGSSISKELSSNGIKVYIGYNKGEERAKAIKKEIEELGRDAEIVKLDVTDYKEVSSTFKEIYNRERHIDILINCAGISIDKLLLQTKEKEIDIQLNINLKGTILCCKEVIKYMLKRGWGRIVNISSVVGEFGNSGQSIYSATKAGIIGFTKSLAKELGPKNITVNVVSPGLVETEMSSHLSEEILKEIKERTPIKRLVTKEEVAKVVSFLISEGANGITGQVIRVNGGIYM